MTRVGRRLRGFTIVELVVVIAVIGILAAITTVGFNKYSASSRDSQRQAKATVIAEALEKYYSQHGEYPSCSQIAGSSSVSGSAVTALNAPLSGIDQNAVITPQAGSGTTNSIQCSDLTSLSDSDIFAYVGDGSSACTSGDSCLNFTLKYKDESDGKIATIASRHNQSISTSGTVAGLTASANAFGSVSLSWTAVKNAASYTVQWSQNNFVNFAQLSPSPNTNTATITGLPDGQTYSFRVAANGTGDIGKWSNTATATTWSLSAPSVTVGTTTASSIAISWSAINHADKYRYQIATDAGFTSIIANGDSTTTNTNYTASGLSMGTQYYMRVQAQDSTGVHQSSWSNVVSPNTIVPTPTNVQVVTNSVSQITESWTGIGGGATYTAQCSTDNSTWNSGCQGSTSASSYAFTGRDQGRTYYTRVQAVLNGFTSTWSGSVSTTTTINAPGAFNMASSNDGTSLYATDYPTCGQGTTPEYLWYANGGGWVQGTQYQSVGYTPSPGQGVTLTSAVRCDGANAQSGWVWANNNASFTRPGLNMSLSAADDGCSGGFCGRRIYAYYNNFCGGGGTMDMYQYSYHDSASVSGGSYSTRWKGASGAGAPTTYVLNMCGASSSASINVNSAYKCSGCS